MRLSRPSTFPFPCFLTLFASIALHAQGGGQGVSLPYSSSTYASFSHDGSLVVTVGDDSLARVWDSKTAQLLNAFRASDGNLYRAVFLPGDSLIVTLRYNDSSFAEWNWRSGTLRRRISVYRPIVRGDISPDGTVLAVLVGTPAYQVELWSIAGGYLQKALPNIGAWVDQRFSSSGNQLTAASIIKGSTAVFDFARSRVDSMHPIAPRIHLFLGSVSPDGTHFVCGVESHPPYIFSLSTFDTVASLDVGSPPLQCNKVQYSPDGRWIVATTSSLGTSRGNAFQWDARTLQVVGMLAAADTVGTNQMFSFSYDSRYIVEFGSGAPVRILPLYLPTQGVGDAVAGAVTGMHVSVAPNPGSGFVTVRYEAASPGPVDVQVANIIGNRVASERANATTPGPCNTQIDVHDLPAGLYFCTVTDSRGIRCTAPLIVAH